MFPKTAEYIPKNFSNVTNSRGRKGFWLIWKSASDTVKTILHTLIFWIQNNGIFCQRKKSFLQFQCAFSAMCVKVNESNLRPHWSGFCSSEISFSLTGSLWQLKDRDSDKVLLWVLWHDFLNFLIFWKLLKSFKVLASVYANLWPVGRHQWFIQVVFIVV